MIALTLILRLFVLYMLQTLFYAICLGSTAIQTYCLNLEYVYQLLQDHLEVGSDEPMLKKQHLKSTIDSLRRNPHVG